MARFAMGAVAVPLIPMAAVAATELPPILAVAVVRFGEQPAVTVASMGLTVVLPGVPVGVARGVACVIGRVARRIVRRVTRAMGGGMVAAMGIPVAHVVLRFVPGFVVTRLVVIRFMVAGIMAFGAMVN